MKCINFEKYKSFSLAVLAAMATLFTACSSDDNIVEEQPVQPTESQVYTMTVNATKGDEATTRALSLDGTTLNATWSTTENVYVKKGSTWATGSLQPQADGTTSTLKGTLSDITIAADDNLTLQFPKSGNISYAGQTGTLVDIAANFDYATATVEVESVSASGNIKPKATTTSFQNQQAIIKFMLKKTDGTELPANPTVFTISDGTSTVSLADILTATYTDNGNGVLYVAFPAAGEAKTITLSATVGSDTYTYKKTGVTFNNGQYYAITVKMTELKNTVDLGLSVYWSRMNVGASSETDYGQFFAWGETTGYNSDASDGHSFNRTNYKYFNGTSDYSPQITKYNNKSSYGNDDFTDVLTTLELTDDAARVNMGGDWRMPTYEEQNELYATKSNSNYTWTWCNGSTVKYRDSTIKGYEIKQNSTGNSIFLPAAGSRNDTSLSSQGVYGLYWSSSLNTTDSRTAYDLNFGVSYAQVNGGGRFYGFSVRAVCDK